MHVVKITRTDLGDLQHMVERQYELLTALQNHQAVDDHNGLADGDFESKRRADSDLRLNGNPPIMFRQFRTHAVQADASSGNFRYLLRRRQPGVKDQLDRLLIADRVGAGSVVQSLCNSFVAQPAGVDSATIVLDRDDDVRAGQFRLEPKIARLVDAAPSSFANSGQI